jgi:2-polyprenyl-3-methyl-5-hydroxy-6-metoxy-1,4-benzoquinol methylase
VKDTSALAYKTRLVSADVWWKRLLDVQRPYRANLASLQLNKVLDVGCGIGRNLSNLNKIGVSAIGVDHNEHSVDEACRRGFEALHIDVFKSTYLADQTEFDAILISHVLEHLTFNEAKALLSEYLPFLKPEGKVVVITPQEAGYATDPTHVNFTDEATIKDLFTTNGIKVEQDYSFPFPRFAGKLFRYNEFVVVGHKA